VIYEERLPDRVSAVVVYSGENQHAVAAQWLDSRRADMLLLPRPVPTRNVQAGIVAPSDVYSRNKLLQLHVSEPAIRTLEDPHQVGEWKYARLLKEWLAEHPEKTTVVLCRRLDSRRTRYSLNQVLSSAEARRVYVLGLPSLDYDEQRWWRSRAGAVNLFQAGLDLVYARLHGEDVDPPVSWDVDAFERGLQPR
jgi:hypothetical protein